MTFQLFMEANFYQWYIRPYRRNKSGHLPKRIANNKYNFTDIETFMPMLQSKNYTYSAISRALLHIILDIKTDGLKEFISNNYVNYAMILGFNKNTGVLSEIMQKHKNTTGKQICNLL